MDDKELIGSLMSEFKDICLKPGIEPEHCVVALVRMAGFMTMVSCGERLDDPDMEFDKQEFYSIVISELDDAFMGAIASRETFNLINRAQGNSDE